MNVSSFRKIAIIFLIISVIPIIDFKLSNNRESSTAIVAAPKKIAVKKKKWKRKRRVRKFALNFKDVDIAEFLNIMGQLIGKNIIIDDKVKGKISISSARKVPLTQAYNIMKSILEVKGLAVIETANLIKVLPIKDAIQKNVEILVDGKPIPIEKTKTLTFLLELKNADADEIAGALRPLKSKFTTIVVYRSLNTLILSGISTEVKGLIKISRALDKEIKTIVEGKTTGNIRVIHLENADAEDLADALSRVPFSETAKINTSPTIRPKVKPSKKTSRITKSHGVSPKKKSKLSIIAYKETNSLIITAKPGEFIEIERLIKALDIVREQVLIEAMIVEVNIENGWGLGVGWMMGYKYGDHLLGGSSLMSSKIPNYTTPDFIDSATKIAVPLATGFQLGYLNDKNVLGFALLNASATDSNFNILSTPQILTIDNNEAELNVGEEIGVPTTNRITDQNTTYQTYEYKTVGIKLKITPHITKKKRITLEIYQEVNSIIGDTTLLDSGSMVPPKLGKRDIKTKVTVMDGKTIVIGGLIKNEKNVSETKVPILGDIPILGWFFKHKTTSYKKTNLLVFITPHIVTNPEKIDSITRQKREIQRRLRNQK